MSASISNFLSNWFRVEVFVFDWLGTSDESDEDGYDSTDVWRLRCIFIGSLVALAIVNWSESVSSIVICPQCSLESLEHDVVSSSVEADSESFMITKNILSCWMEMVKTNCSIRAIPLAFHFQNIPIVRTMTNAQFVHAGSTFSLCLLLLSFLILLVSCLTNTTKIVPIYLYQCQSNHGSCLIIWCFICWINNYLSSF